MSLGLKSQAHRRKSLDFLVKSRLFALLGSNRCPSAEMRPQGAADRQPPSMCRAHRRSLRFVFGKKAPNKKPPMKGGFNLVVLTGLEEVWYANG